MIVPIADADATPEPEIAPKSIFAIEFVCAKDPGTLPVRT